MSCSQHIVMDIRVSFAESSRIIFSVKFDEGWQNFEWNLENATRNINTKVLTQGSHRESKAPSIHRDTSAYTRDRIVVSLAVRTYYTGDRVCERHRKRGSSSMEANIGAIFVTYYRWMTSYPAFSMSYVSVNIRHENSAFEQILLFFAHKTQFDRLSDEGP